MSRNLLFRARFLVGALLLSVLLPSGGPVLCIRPLAQASPEWSDWEGHCACGASRHASWARPHDGSTWREAGCFDLRLGGEWARLRRGGELGVAAWAAFSSPALPLLPGRPLGQLHALRTFRGPAPPGGAASHQRQQALLGVLLC